MPTTRQQIASNLAAIIDPATSNPYFYNSSAAAMYNKIADALAPIIDNTLAENVNTQAIIQDIINNQRYGKHGYYTTKALLFQYNDSLIVDPVTLEPVYSVIDTTKQIVKQAAFEISGSYTLTIKVAKVSGGVLVKLDPATEKVDFDTYFTNFEIPGLPVTKISIDPNYINFDVAIIYNPNYDLSSLITAIQAAIIVFNTTFPFNGIFYKNGLYGFGNYMVANVPGIIDITISNMTIDGGAFPVNPNYTQLPAGYFNYDGSIVGKFNDTNNYSTP